MSILHAARRPPRWLRAVLAAFALAFALNAIAHVSHGHDASPASVVHSLACNYCVSFGALADAPRHGEVLPPAARASAQVSPYAQAPVLARLVPSARPRAPPR